MQLFGYDVDIPFFEEQMTPQIADSILAQPNHPRTWQGYSQVAGALNIVGKHREAEWLMRKAVNCERNGITLMNLAFIMHTNGKYREAFPIAEEAYLLDPLNKWTAVLYGESLLRLERWGEGWDVREKFYWDTHWGKFARHFPIWNGEDLRGKRIAVPNFEGYGDCIMYFAWVRALKDLGAKVIFYCEENMVPLFEGHAWLHEVRPIVAKEVYFGLEHFDYFLPIVALPNRFDADPKPIPWQGPYITAYPKFRHHREGKRIIGLCSRAGEITAQFSTRALTLEQKNALLAIDAEWVNLDFGDQPLIKNWSDTASLIDILDLVVTVDTGVAHLAGAMGKPTWVLVNGGLTAAWYGVDRETCAFYPSMRLFRNQGPGLENSVCAAAEALQSL